jgi:hypothetical protein
MRVDPAFVCCHVFMIRVILASQRQPYNRRSRRIVVCARAPSRLIAIMKPSTVARCIVVNEYLRRRNQPPCNATTRIRLSHHVDLLSVTFEQIPGEPQLEVKGQIPSNHGQLLVSSAANGNSDADTFSVRSIALEKINTSTSKSQSSAESILVLKMKADTGTC